MYWRNWQACKVQQAHTDTFGSFLTAQRIKKEKKNQNKPIAEICQSFYVLTHIRSFLRNKQAFLDYRQKLQHKQCENDFHTFFHPQARHQSSMVLHNGAVCTCLIANTLMQLDSLKVYFSVAKLSFWWWETSMCAVGWSAAVNGNWFVEVITWLDMVK